jgi:hypothetical protein
MPEIETDVPFNVSGVKNAAEGGAAVVLTFYKRPHRRPDAHFALTPHAALHLTQYIRETLAESEVLGADADPILPRIRLRSNWSKRQLAPMRGQRMTQRRRISLMHGPAGFSWRSSAVSRRSSNSSC